MVLSETIEHVVRYFLTRRKMEDLSKAFHASRSSTVMNGLFFGGSESLIRWSIVSEAVSR